MIETIRRFQIYTPLVLLVIIGAIAGMIVDQRTDERQTGPSLFSRDARADGTLALAMWLERMGYDVRRLEWTEAVPDRSTDLLFVLSPTRRFRDQEAEDVVEWVKNGGVLVYLPNRFIPGSRTGATSDGLMEQLGLEARRSGRISHATLAVPLEHFPTLREVDAGATLVLDLQDESWAPLLLSERRVLAASRQMGRGFVYAFTTPALFDNLRIGSSYNSEVLLQVLQQHAQLRRVAFDEYHHGFVRDPDLMSAMRSNPWGWAVMYAAALTFLFILWGGRRFGPAIIPERVIGRSTGDYVSALAGLIQRARATEWAQREYARLLRRDLGRILGIRADSSLAELQRVLESRRGGAECTITQRLHELEGRTMGERALLERMREAELELRGLRGAGGAHK